MWATLALHPIDHFGISKDLLAQFLVDESMTDEAIELSHELTPAGCWLFDGEPMQGFRADPAGCHARKLATPAGCATMGT